MKSFKQYAKQTPKGEQRTQNNEKERISEENATASAEELTQKIAAAYQGRSNADMLRNILAEAEKSKRAGTLSNDDIDEFYRQFEPMLSGEQREQLRLVVERLKEL